MLENRARIGLLLGMLLFVGCQWPDGANYGRRFYGQPIVDMFTAGVIDVVEGDTITVVDSNETKHKVRLAAVDCPEIKQPYSTVAKVVCSSLCYLKTVDIYQTGVDSNGRILAFVIADGVNVNAELLRLGAAWHSTENSDSADLAALEGVARESRVGLWEDNDPIPPWEWREQRVAARQ